MAFFHPFTHMTLSENTEKAVKELFKGRYNVRRVEKGFGNGYRVYTKDGHRMNVYVGTKPTLFGGEKTYITYIDE